jgi:uncharacterized membrane protein
MIIRALFYIIPLSFTLFLAKPAFSSERAVHTAHSLEERGLSPLLIAGLISMVPIFELRGGIPIGIAVLNQHPLIVYCVAVLFNLIPIFPVLLFLNPVKRIFEKLPVFRGFFQFLSKKAEKNKKLIEKYEELGLMLFVAIPLPVTGAWTGSLVAVVMGLKTVKSFLFIAAGVFIAGIIVTLLTVLGKIGAVLAAVLLLSFIILYIVNLLKERKKGIQNVIRKNKGLQKKN